ncbi:MAG: nicotinate (nicotinamide) nucleotide adenylyltransferase [Armatimonadetes bacterium]|nr:nicotinate (nicotinamide) nucleotide adenylyltransferase [Armatimonadota bacterium]
MKIGLLGGSFNPIHNGHIAIAENALEQLELDKILFLPVGMHPLKTDRNIPPFEIRYKLLETVLKSFPDFEVSTLDEHTENLNYTEELIKKLKIKFPDNEFFFIAGDDIVSELPRWHNYKWLLDNVKIVVFNRFDTDRSEWKNLDYLNKLFFLEMKPVNISSNVIREKIRKGENVSGLVPEIIIPELKKLYS